MVQIWPEMAQIWSKMLQIIFSSFLLNLLNINTYQFYLSHVASIGGHPLNQRTDTIKFSFFVDKLSVSNLVQ